MIIFRYITKEILSALLAVTLVLLTIFMTNQFVHYMKDAARGVLTIRAVMEIMSLQVPLLLGNLLSLSLFLGILLGLGRLYTDREITVLSACGVSRLRLLSIVMFVAFLIAVLVGWLMLSVGPKMQWNRIKIIDRMITHLSFQKVLPGQFQYFGKDDSNVFYAVKVSRNHVMHDVFWAEQKSSKKSNRSISWSVVSACKARELQNSNGSFILFENGYRYIGIPGHLNCQVIKFSQYGIRLMTPHPNISLKSLTAMPTIQLFKHRNKNPSVAAEWQWRISMPISVLVLAFLAVPLSEINPRQGKFTQLLPAILFYIVYANLMFISRVWVEKGVIPMVLGLWWIHLSVFIVALLRWIRPCQFLRLWNRPRKM